MIQLFIVKKGKFMAKYQSVNGKWPEGTNDGRDIVPSEQEAISGAKRLYRKAFGKPFRGKVKTTSGRNYTYVRRHVLYVNPNQKSWAGNGGWHEIVHGLSHYAARSIWNEAHGARHAFIERELIEYVVAHGFLEGKLRSKAKPKPEKKIEKHAALLTKIQRWESKLKRAQNALKKLNRTLVRYEKAVCYPPNPK